jgi:hypothetical protein
MAPVVGFHREPGARHREYRLSGVDPAIRQGGGAEPPERPGRVGELGRQVSQTHGRHLNNTQLGITHHCGRWPLQCSDFATIEVEPVSWASATAAIPNIALIKGW